MADLFNFEQVEEGKVGGGNAQKYIYPGIRHKVVVKNLKEDKTPNGTPFIELELYTKEGGPENSTKFPLYTSEKALKYTMERLKHIATAIVKEEDVNKAKNVEDLRDLIKGGVLRMKFHGEEYINKNGEVKEKATIPVTYPFAEAIEDGAEKPAIADEDTKLTDIDKNNQYEFKKVEVNPTPDPASDISALDPVKAAW